MSDVVANLGAFSPPRDEFVGPLKPSALAEPSGSVGDSIFAAIRGAGSAIGAFGAAIPQPWQDALLARIAKGTAANASPTVQAKTAEEILRTKGLSPSSLQQALAVSPGAQTALLAGAAVLAVIVFAKVLR